METRETLTFTVAHSRYKSDGRSGSRFRDIPDSFFRAPAYSKVEPLDCSCSRLEY